MIKTISICGKTSDLCSTVLIDDKGKTVADKSGYVPDFMPGEHYGDYLILNIDVATGRITNWKAPTQKKLLTFAKQ